MTEPQMWTVIGVLAAALFGTLTLMSTLFLKIMEANAQRVDARFEGVGERFERLEEKFDARFERLETKFDTKFDHLDRDIRTLFGKVFPDYPDAG